MSEKTTWVLDPTHSEIQFKVKHLMISTVTGQFNKFEGTVVSEANDFSTASASLTIDVDSISTNNEQRDQHLKNSDFFDTENHPELRFQSTGIEQIDDENYKINGTLTMRGVTKPVAFDAELGGIIRDNWGNERAGFAISGKLNRKDFGVSFNALTETGGVALGEEVKFLINAQFVKQVPVAG